MLREARLTGARQRGEHRRRRSPDSSRAAFSPHRTDTAVSNKYVGTGAAMVLVLGLLVAKFSGPPDFSYVGCADKTLSVYVQAFRA